MSGTLGIIAGGGELPAAIAESARAAGRDVFVFALHGMAQAQDINPFPHEWGSLGEVGKGMKVLRDAGVTEVTLAGKVARPEWNAIKLDAKGALALPKVVAAAMKGDDALLRVMVELFEKEGFRVIGTAEAAPDLVMPKGKLGRHAPTKAQENDIAVGVKAARALGALDIGQAVAVCEGLVLAVEAAEGTDAMIGRIASLPTAVRGTPANRRGVLVKTPKPKQERRVDLPVIGVHTIEIAAEAGLAGVAVEAGAALLMHRARTIETADRLGLFILGFDAGAYPG
jgi:DUF1009 family protein